MNRFSFWAQRAEKDGNVPAPLPKLGPKKKDERPSSIPKRAPSKIRFPKGNAPNFSNNRQEEPDPMSQLHGTEIKPKSSKRKSIEPKETPPIRDTSSISDMAKSLSKNFEQNQSLLKTSSLRATEPMLVPPQPIKNPEIIQKDKDKDVISDIYGNQVIVKDSEAKRGRSRSRTAEKNNLEGGHIFNVPKSKVEINKDVVLPFPQVPEPEMVLTEVNNNFSPNMKLQVCDFSHLKFQL